MHSCCVLTVLLAESIPLSFSCERSLVVYRLCCLLDLSALAFHRYSSSVYSQYCLLHAGQCVMVLQGS